MLAGVKRTIKRLVLAIPGGLAILRAHDLRRSKRLVAGARGMDVFTRHYEQAFWGEGETLSGPGSTVQYTENVRKELPRLLERLGVRRLLDAPCGDYNWFRLVERPGVHYVGGDVVPALVARNRERHATDDTEFVVLDITKDQLPAADLWLCRDCLFHLSFDDVFRALANFVRSDVRHLLTSVHLDCDYNADIATGAARLLDLRLDPFFLPEPLEAIEDWIPGFPRRSLFLWDRETVARALAGNPRLRRVERELSAAAREPVE